MFKPHFEPYLRNEQSDYAPRSASISAGKRIHTIRHLAASEYQKKLSMKESTPLRLKAVSKSFGPIPVLDEISLALNNGDIVGLLGTNGSGKTTLLKTALGITTPASGVAYIFDEPSLTMSDRAKAQLAYVPQDPELFGWLTGLDVLNMMRGLYPSWNHEEAFALAERWHVPLNEIISTLSPGQQQRLQIVRAFATNAKLLILDEPVSSLDPAGRRQFLSEMMGRCAERSITALFSTHIVSDLERCANKVAVLHRGKILLFDELDTLKTTLFRLELPKWAVGGFKKDINTLQVRHHNAEYSMLVLRANLSTIQQVLAEHHQSAIPVPLSLEDFVVELSL